MGETLVWIPFVMEVGIKLRSLLSLFISWCYKEMEFILCSVVVFIV